VLREFHTEKPEQYKIGDSVTVESLKEAKEVTLSATSKGKGFAGFIKRHHFSSGPGSHGSHHKREPGSIGARSKPGRIHKGKKMAGHMGFDRVTRKSVPLVEVNSEKNLLVLKGPVPGPRGALVEIRSNSQIGITEKLFV
ncbi:50S ribosomal protein L3, partial [Candidatus Peregrinibacteria bacterium]|nr:50S ribosomal protein L3 [Candidatus Peregrinibacteria bacterium]